MVEYRKILNGFILTYVNHIEIFIRSGPPIIYYIYIGGPDLFQSVNRGNIPGLPDYGTSVSCVSKMGTQKRKWNGKWNEYRVASSP